MEVWESAVRELCCLSAFLWLAIQDKKYFGITRGGLLVSSLLILFGGCFSDVGWQSRVGGAAVGVVLLLFGYFSAEAIGLADGVVVFVSGIASGLYETVCFSFLAALYAGLVSSR